MFRHFRGKIGLFWADQAIDGVKGKKKVHHQVSYVCPKGGRYPWKMTKIGQNFIQKW